MAFCTQCGSKLNDGAVFCGQCGAKVFSGTAQSQSTNNGFFNKLNSTVQKAVNGAQQVVGDLSGSQSAKSVISIGKNPKKDELTFKNMIKD